MIEIFFGNCLEIMKGLPDLSIDCFICDLPYGQLRGSGLSEVQSKAKEKDCAWDIKIDLVEFWKQVERLAKNDTVPVIHFCNTKFGIDLINSKPNWFRYDLVWNKNRGVSFLLANKMPLKSHEMIYIFSKKGSYYKRIDEDDITKRAHSQFNKDLATTKRSANMFNSNNLTRAKGCPEGKRCSRSVLTYTNVGTFKTAHPTEKPKELYAWLLRRYCPDGGTVLDPTAGSFNSIFVAKELGINAIGIEMNEVFFKNALKKFIDLKDKLND